MFQKMLFTILITISVLLTVTVVFPHEKGFSVTIPQATMPPEIDGIGKDVIWQFAPEVTIDNINTGGKVKKGEVSTAKAVYDKDNIYVLFINNSLDTRKMQMVAQKHDQDIWKDEENELFIDTEHDAAKPYYHIMINAKNVTQDAHNGGAENGWEAKLESEPPSNVIDSLYFEFIYLENIETCQIALKINGEELEIDPFENKMEMQVDFNGTIPIEIKVSEICFQ